jgi:predicted DNA-binding protein with PD1-like motif
MKSIFDGFNYIVRLERGEKLVESLVKLVKEKEIKGAWVSGLGAVEWVELGFYNLDTGEYEWKKLDERLELTGMTGNIAWQNDEPVFHMHGTFGEKDLSIHGGHVKEAEVAGTVELFIHMTYKPLSRKKDTATGLNLLDF